MAYQEKILQFYEGKHMIFDSVNNMKRPVRLSETTRRFAYESLNHRYGLDTRNTPAVSLDHLPDYETMTQLQRYDAAIEEIAKTAPIRICEGEKLSGAATLGLAIDHLVPAVYKGKAVCDSISHLTVDFETVLKIGTNGIRRKAEAAMKKYKGTEREPFIDSCLHCLDCFDLWHRRYLDELKDRPEYQTNYQCLQRVPLEPPTHFREAVQSLWFTFAFLRLCGNWPGIGRIDWLLGSYLEKDLKDGVLSMEEAREILAHFFIKGCEWICGGDYGSGDAQHYQNILLAGIDENGKEVTNAVTYLVLDIIEELGIGDFPTTVRLNRNTDEKLLRRVAEVMRYGEGILAVYNEDLILESLTKYGYPLCDARKFANDGCWEVQIPGKTFFTYMPFDSLAILQKNTLKNYQEPLNYPDFETLYRQFILDLQQHVETIFQQKKTEFDNADPSGQWHWRPHTPCTAVSLFEEGCIEKGLSYLEGGPVYNVTSPHIGGLADTANSLYAIKKVVYEEKKLTLGELTAILQKNWEGEEALRRYLLTHYAYFGNDNDEIDALTAQILEDFTGICRKLDHRCGYRFPAGVSTFGRQLEWSKHRLAAPHGKKAGEVLAANCSPTPGTDQEGATAMIRSYCKLPLKKTVTGAALDLKLLPSSTQGEDGLEALVALMRGFTALGGYFMQPDIINAEILKEAQKHPENYQTLSVRVSGWNARFVTLNEEWQNMIIEQNGQ